LGAVVPEGGYGTLSSGAAKGAMWTSTKSQSVAENAFRHFKDHGADFGAKNAVDYARQAQNFMHNPGAGVLSKYRANGDVVRFDPATNAFGVMDKTGAARTFYKPDPGKHGYPTNLDYFNA
jgi:pyocin large subunit-like protein